jgi:UDP-N-acetylmuramate--alanine ligase
LQDLGIKVRGSDAQDVFLTDKFLDKRKVKWQAGFSKKNLSPKPDLVVTTSAHGGLKNPEVIAARKGKIPVLTHAQALGKLMEGKDGISVCGVGGKSTTSAMIAALFEVARRKPSYAVGVASINPLGYGGRYQEGQEFIAEADEYANCATSDPRPRFTFQKPKVAVVTNIEFDHPDIYQNLDQAKTVFQAFFSKLPNDGLLIACIDNANIAKTIKKSAVNIQTYGFSPQADWQIEKIYHGQEQTLFSLSYQKAVFDQIKLKVPGRFNVLNAAAAFAVGTFFGIDAKTIKKGLVSFGGTKRRFELIGEVGTIKLYDDYAHHPKEIVATLSAARQWLPGRKITVIFQPHTYSRTKALLKDFARAFPSAHRVIITDIYATVREKDDLGMNGQLLAQAVRKHHPRAIHLPGEAQVAEYLGETVEKNEAIFTLGAGDIFLWHDSILKAIKK